MKVWFPIPWVLSRDHHQPFSMLFLLQVKGCPVYLGYNLLSPPTRHMCTHICHTHHTFVMVNSTRPSWALIESVPWMGSSCDLTPVLWGFYTHEETRGEEICLRSLHWKGKLSVLKINVVVFWDRASCTLSWPLTHSVPKEDRELVTLPLYPLSARCTGVHHHICVCVWWWQWKPGSCEC